MGTQLCAMLVEDQCGLFKELVAKRRKRRPDCSRPEVPPTCWHRFVTKTYALFWLEYSSSVTSSNHSVRIPEFTAQ